jgi:hypothetical protein
MKRTRPPTVEIVTGVGPAPASPRQVAAELKALVAGGAELRPAGQAADDPELLLGARYRPRHRVDLFGTRFYLASYRYEEGLNFMPAFVVPARGDRVFPRVFYKDSTLLWRVASHMIRNEDSDWIGKGDVRVVREGGEEYLDTDEDSTNLPYELQAAIDAASRELQPKRDERCVELLVRNAPEGRIEPYADFSAPRRRAERRTPLNGNRPVARIARRGDPTSLRFARGFEPDLEREPLELTRSASRLYGGRLRKYRVLSKNGLIQYQFVAAPRHGWSHPPQALTPELTSYGVRALHVRADDEIFIPGYEYHFHDADGELHSQIPEGFAGGPSRDDPARADTRAWTHALPIVRAFAERVLGRRLATGP